MSGLAVRSRLLTLMQERRAAQLGRELLDRKREAILRELIQRLRRRDAQRDVVRDALRAARRTLRAARIETGRRRIEAAILAQPVSASVDMRGGSLVGVPMPRLQPRLLPFVPHYGTAATTATLDEAGAQFSGLLAALVRLAEEEEAARNLQLGLSKTVRRLKALEQVVLPRLDREVRDVTAALEEDERDESIRRKSWVNAAASARDPLA
jgi:V/A-type H+-transporting ATPase subunit D